LGEVEPWAQASERAPVRGDEDDDFGTLPSQVAILRACLAGLYGDIGRAEAMARLAEDDPGYGAQALASVLIGSARYFQGDAAGAVAELGRARGLIRPGGFQMELAAMSALTAARVTLCEIAAAEGLAGEMERFIESYGFAESPTASQAR